MKNYAFSEIIGWSLAELIENQDQIEELWIRLYAKTLCAYLKSDLKSLKENIEEMKSYKTDFFSDLDLISELRLEIRNRKVNENTLQRVLLISNKNKLLTGEIFFILGLAYEILNNEEKCKSAYLQAAEHLEKIGSNRKAVKALFNALAAETRMHKDNKKYLPDYSQFIRRAKALKNYSVVGIAYLNISREYQKIGALTAALKYATLAIGYLNKYDYGSLDYYSALTHRAHVWIDLGRHTDAKMDMELAQIADFVEIKSALLVLDSILNGQKNILQISMNLLFPGWRERLLECKTYINKNFLQPMRPSLSGALEGKLLSLLHSGPRDKFFLMDELYGKNLSIETRENRLKNLLNRIRTKSPGLIRFWSGKYEIDVSSKVQKYSQQ